MMMMMMMIYLLHYVTLAYRSLSSVLTVCVYVCVYVCVICSVLLGVEMIWQILGVVCLARHYNTCHDRAAMQAVLGKSTVPLVNSQQN